MPLEISILVAFIVIQQFFWMGQVKKLVDRIMAGSYAEFKRHENQPKEVLKVVAEQPDPEFGSLNALNPY